MWRVDTQVYSVKNQNKQKPKARRVLCKWIVIINGQICKCDTSIGVPWTTMTVYLSPTQIIYREMISSRGALSGNRYGRTDERRYDHVGMRNRLWSNSRVMAFVARGGGEDWDEPGRLVERWEGSGRLIVRLIITDKPIGQNTKTNKMCDPPRTLLQSRSSPPM